MTFVFPWKWAVGQTMLVPTRTPCCCLGVSYLAEKPLGENSWSSVIVAEHPSIPTSTHVQISQKWALKLPSKSPLGNVPVLKTALGLSFKHFPFVFLGMMHAWLSQFFLSEEVFLCVENGSCIKKKIVERNLMYAQLMVVFLPPSVFSSCFAVQSSRAVGVPSSNGSVVPGACCRWACHPLLLFGGLFWVQIQRFWMNISDLWWESQLQDNVTEGRARFCCSEREYAPEQ